MHNHWEPIPCPPPDCGDPIVGKIVNGRTYPFGDLVKKEDYIADKAVLDDKISEIEDQLSQKCGIRIQEAEPQENSVLWIKPVQTGIAPLMLGENTGGDGVLVSANGTTRRTLNVFETRLISVKEITVLKTTKTNQL